MSILVRGKKPLTERHTTLGRLTLIRSQGYVLLTLLLFIVIMSLGLMVAVPVWQTQIQREKEEELIFRGKQYVEAIRIYQLKHPGRFPSKLEELLEEKCIRRLWRDPMTSHGEWNLVLLGSAAGGKKTETRPEIPSRRRPPLGAREARPREQAFSPQQVLIVPQAALSSIQNPQILGVVSSSSEKSIRLYNEQDTYDKWLFYYGQDSQKSPEIVYPEKRPRFP